MVLRSVYRSGYHMGMTEAERVRTLRHELARWGRLHKRRDALVLEALAAGISRESVHILTGLGRTTIDRIAKSKQQEEQGQ